MIDNSLEHLHPELKPLAQQWLDQYTALGRKVEIAETWRSPQREDELHAEGITPATGITCDHCFMIGNIPASKAFDFRLYDEDGNYITDGMDEWYAEAGNIAKKLGLVWGGDFTHPDYDHIQLLN